ncbi:MAG: hypothetical protein Fur0024_0980 [Patescibacteria group bacterium]
MKILNLKKELKNFVLEETLKVLNSGGLVVFPTETMYGIGADAESGLAVERLLEFKSKRENKPISIVCADLNMAKNYVEINFEAEKIYKNFLPGPVTVVSKAKIPTKLFSKVLSPSGTVGVRIPDYDLILEISKDFGRAFTATSSNPSGGKRPYSVQDVLDQLSEKQKKLVDLILDAGELPKNPPSTVIDTTVGEVSVLRSGKINFKFTKNFLSKSVNETINFAKNLMDEKKEILKNRCVIFALQGEMGAGKTQFSKGIAKSLGILEVVKSPTFNFVNEYEIESQKSKVKSQKIENNKFFHIDTWRLSSPQELESLCLKEMVKNGNVICIEWADRFSDVIEKFAHLSAIFWIDIKQISKNEREIKF